MLTNILSVERRRRNDDDDDGLGDYHDDDDDGNEDLDDDVDDADEVADGEYDEGVDDNDDTYAAAADDDGRSVGEAGRHVACAVSTSFQERERHLTPRALEASQGVWEPPFLETVIFTFWATLDPFPGNQITQGACVPMFLDSHVQFLDLEAGVDPRPPTDMTLSEVGN